ncbi:HIT family hydrolase [Campylobacter sp. RM9344]|uniref:HIT family hydrolase n=1 Tax=Campylobacter californiensis TaxID=1032243 RepID=A0AAW3ZU22_9BACT|nr:MULTISPECIES: HIT family hydrolase [unclassified Campylobacter]MBE2985350.1 HIT family hydrolase [Campylobacter sp. RM6883]MBE2995883.1 HIT family hydrolase [Campylobacter sp. RM6913]MBE3030113.1 HIT family hydrolase [Campylobacter sp. RM9344]MBE3608767.1 HIT family hydrolase [Campylobacter sp. RM9337]QCD51227.1 hypothetical protein CCAL_1342 [Campylobacter sp. RM6914]
MTEQEAILSLLGDVEGGEEMADNTVAVPSEGAGEPNGAEAANNDGASANQSITAQSLQSMIANAMAGIEAKKAEQAKAEQEAQVKTQAQALSPEMQTLLEQLGLTDINQMREQLNALQQQQAQAQEMARRQEIFNKNLDTFNKDFPTIKAEELGEWAEKNGFLNLLGEDYNGWKAVAMAMINVAKPTSEPDPILGADKAGGELGVFDKLKNGEEVDDVEIGAQILKSAGLV